MASFAGGQKKQRNRQARPEETPTQDHISSCMAFENSYGSCVPTRLKFSCENMKHSLDVSRQRKFNNIIQKAVGDHTLPHVTTKHDD
ncbi:hypothetical protein JOB18_043636 [Solea senegalensis]|uniref:Uncharacterized protein n=1 Tax=Solea senegalensis TaxID=28829 RepID=A0AAV6SBK0_SOLSE|nr:hypothetical protein JOB18_043636 [Solea senegalensis]